MIEIKKDASVGYILRKGGAGSGNYGHVGRPGKVGGSSPADGLSANAGTAIGSREAGKVVTRLGRKLRDIFEENLVSLDENEDYNSPENREWQACLRRADTQAVKDLWSAIPSAKIIQIDDEGRGEGVEELTVHATVDESIDRVLESLKRSGYKPLEKPKRGVHYLRHPEGHDMRIIGPTPEDSNPGLSAMAFLGRHGSGGGIAIQFSPSYELGAFDKD